MTRWTWTAASGLVTELSAWDAGNYVTDDLGGVFAPEYEFAAQELAGIDGAEVTSISARPGSPSLGIDYVAADPLELRARIRALAHALSPRAGMGRLTAVDDDGSTRHVDCFYRQGLASGRYRANRFRAVLEFYAPSPWWRGRPLADAWDLAAPSAFFPILPMRLSPSTISGERTFDLSDTDADTYPVWTVTGPGGQLNLTNRYPARNPDGAVVEVTRSLVLTPAGGIGDGQLVVINTRPGHQAVNRATRNPDGTVVLGASIFRDLASDPAMFPLVNGVNTVSALLTNAGPASRVEVAAERLYSGAL